MPVHSLLDYMAYMHSYIFLMKVSYYTQNRINGLPMPVDVVPFINIESLGSRL